MADAKALPVFCFDTKIPQHLSELRAFLALHGAKVDENGPADFVENLMEIVSSISVVGDLSSDKEVEMVLSSIVSLFNTIVHDSILDVVSEFARQLSAEKFGGFGWASNAGAAVRSLSDVFHMFNQLPAVQHRVFLALVILCGRARIIGDLDTSIDQVNEYAAKWGLDKKQHRNLLRLIHAALINDFRADQAAKTMTALLGTYTDEDAASALDDARECVRTAIVDPKSFSFDHLLRLSAVKLLEKSDSEIFELLKLFSEGRLADYKAFTAKHPTFVADKLHVDEAVLIKKIRLLTLMSMAEKSSVIDLTDLSREVDIREGEELEEFIIEAIQVNAITGKINEIKNVFNVSSLQHRCFGRPQWEMLQKRMITLIASLKGTYENIRNIQGSDSVAS